VDSLICSHAEAESRLNALYAKQGRLTQFRTKAERDVFLRKEIQSIGNYHARLTQDLEDMRDATQRDAQRLATVEAREAAVNSEMEERKEKLRVLGEELASLKEIQSEKVEKRKCVYFMSVK